jgi:hypothetical protein
MKAHLSHVMWGRVLLSGLLIAILAAVLNVVLLWLASTVWGQPSLAHPITYQVASWGTYILAILLTVGGAVWVARTVKSEAPLHGLLVGLVAALIFLFLNSSFTNFLGGAYRGNLDMLVMALGPFVLMVAAGWLGGILGDRGREQL